MSLINKLGNPSMQEINKTKVGKRVRLKSKIILGKQYCKWYKCYNKYFGPFTILGFKPSPLATLSEQFISDCTDPMLSHFLSDASVGCERTNKLYEYNT